MTTKRGSKKNDFAENIDPCVENQHADKSKVVTASKNGHVQLSLCEEFFEILTNKEVMEEVKELMRRAKAKTDTEKEESTVLYTCGHCEDKIKVSQTSVKCIRCEFWIHLKCIQFTLGAEARKNQNTFLCKSCEVL